LQAHAVETGDSTLAGELAPLVERLDPLLERLERATGAGDSVSYRVLARMDHTPFQSASPGFDSELAKDFQRMTFVLNDGLLDLYDREIGAPSRRRLFAPLDSLNVHGQQAALSVSIEALRRYELKYGPGSARLNLFEAALNHVLQHWAPFGPGDDGPGPWELIAGYSSAYATVAGEKLRAVSAVELGLRHYFYMSGWGDDDAWTGYLRPRYFTFGMLVSGAEDGALRAPGGAGQSRLGGFVSWGGIKAAYIGGDEPRFMLSRQMQFIPNLF
jgi:hypothetical protein